MPRQPSLSICTKKAVPQMNFQLSYEQKKIAAAALYYLRQKRDVLIYAAAGAGKTEITLESISWFLSQGLKVCFAISRRQVVLELKDRLQTYFPQLQVIAVCQGYTKITDADLIVCTTHQLYRYPGCFDLLILDEMDAFPYFENEVLENIAMASCRGSTLMLSATPDPKNLKKIREGKLICLELFKRPHGKPLCVPKVYISNPVFLFIRMLGILGLLKRQKKQVLLYVPRITDTIWMHILLAPFFKVSAVHSKSENRDERMREFREGEWQILICTTLLERGITVGDVQVIVWRADHPVFTTASLIQIFGRVGRSMRSPCGKAWCFNTKKSKALKTCIAQIQKMNTVSGV